MIGKFNLNRIVTELSEDNDSSLEELFIYYYPKLFNFSKSFSKIEDGIDDILTFSIEGIRDNGNLYGTISHDAGPDGQYGEFTLVKQEVPAPPANVYNSKFRTISVDEGSWERDFGNNVLAF